MAQYLFKAGALHFGCRVTGAAAWRDMLVPAQKGVRTRRIELGSASGGKLQLSALVGSSCRASTQGARAQESQNESRPFARQRLRKSGLFKATV
ncbi:hypothetical protein [Polaromonas sp. CG_9.11]|uniref:hypothetical protein n=1 Tax=Polaromonas sp. CG_9.11 TaxID=2787730 RepID=UPI0018CBE9D8|nr:hypothetical protein [Polaromonas sp. CG_9.11]MBG6076070.1 hypothetical protein [Polaromonas sp. CG_9.11]